MVRWATIVSGCVLVLSIAVSVQIRSVLAQEVDSAVDGYSATVDDAWFEEEADDPLESERELKRMINVVTPLMEIFHLGVSARWTRSAGSEGEARRNRPGYQNSYQVAPAKSGYGDYGSASSYGGGGYGGNCCYGNNDLLPILAIVALSLLLLYLITVATTTTSGTGKRRRSAEDNTLDDIELLDAPAWLSMVQDLWEHDAEMADKSLSCAQRTLCRMNRVARSSPTKASWAVSLSSVPLSYLLHHRHQGGFTNYLDASLMGMSGANCSMIYSECPRLL